MKDRLNAYKLASSPEQSTDDMVTEVPEKPARKAPVKRAAAAASKKSAKTVLSDVSEDQDGVNGSDNESDIESVPKEGRRKKTSCKTRGRSKEERTSCKESSGSEAYN